MNIINFINLGFFIFEKRIKTEMLITDILFNHLRIHNCLFIQKSSSESLKKTSGPDIFFFNDFYIVRKRKTNFNDA